MCCVLHISAVVERTAWSRDVFGPCWLLVLAGVLFYQLPVLHSLKLTPIILSATFRLTALVITASFTNYTARKMLQEVFSTNGGFWCFVTKWLANKILVRMMHCSKGENAIMHSHHLKQTQRSWRAWGMAACVKKYSVSVIKCQTQMRVNQVSSDAGIFKHLKHLSVSMPCPKAEWQSSFNFPSKESETEGLTILIWVDGLRLLIWLNPFSLA